MDSFSNTIKLVQLLSGYSANTHKEEEVGRRLYDDLDTVMKIFGKEYNHVVDINFDLESVLTECIERRTSLDKQIKMAKTTSAMILIEPRKDRVIFKHNSVMDEMLEEILSDDTLSQVEKDEKIVKLNLTTRKLFKSSILNSLMLMMKLFKGKKGNNRIKRICIGIRQDSDGRKNMQSIPRVYSTISE